MRAGDAKRLAKGRWLEVLSAMGVDLMLLDGRHHPCPKCGGKDRFRVIDEENGVLYCNQCFSHRNGDGLAAVQWWCNTSLADAIKMVTECLDGKPAPKTLKRAKKRDAKVYWTATEATDALAEYMGKWDSMWKYHNADGDVVGIVYRWDKPDGKEIRPLSKRGVGWTVGAMEPPRPLYQLPTVLESAAYDATVYVTEGEKAADAARSLAVIATTSSGGSNAAKHTDWSPLAGRNVVILPDNDKAGMGYAKEVMAILKKLDPPARVTVLELGGLEEGSDIADWVAVQKGIATARALLMALGHSSEAKHGNGEGGSSQG